MEERFFCEACEQDFEILAEDDKKVEYCPFCGEILNYSSEEETKEYVEDDDLLEDDE